MISRETEAELRARLAEATPGPWESDSIDTEDGHGKYLTYEITCNDSFMNVVVEFSNATVVEIHEESDGDGFYSRWDEVSRRNAAFIVAVRNHLPALLDQIASDREMREEAAARDAKWRNAMIVNENAARADECEKLARWLSQQDARCRPDTLAAALLAKLRTAVPAEERQS